MRRRLLRQIAVGLLAAVIGFLLVSQARGQERFTERLEAESEGDLARILAALNAQADALRDEIDDLRFQVVALQNASRSGTADTESAREELAALEVLAGTTPVRGTGVTLRIDDPQKSLRFDALIDVVQELRDAGAEALAVNGIRIGVRTAFGERDGAVTVDGQAVSAPYTVSAIGQPETLEGGLLIPGGAVDTLKAAKQVEVTVDRVPELLLPALAATPTFAAARPVGSAG
jgi:uncharacterized protein YlxW (UPF0749 family)